MVIVTLSGLDEPLQIYAFKTICQILKDINSLQVIQNSSNFAANSFIRYNICGRIWLLATT